MKKSRKVFIFVMKKTKIQSKKTILLVKLFIFATKVLTNFSKSHSSETPQGEAVKTLKIKEISEIRQYQKVKICVYEMMPFC